VFKAVKGNRNYGGEKVITENTDEFLPDCMVTSLHDRSFSNATTVNFIRLHQCDYFGKDRIDA
jgi:hypothetical protein